MNIPKSPCSRVVIVGGGFGGLTLAKNLHSKNFQVILLDKNNYHSFQPLLYQVATAGLDPGSIAYPFRKIFNDYKNFYFRMATLKRILSEENRIDTDIGFLEYDFLVIATGASTNFFGNSKMAEKAMSMKSLPEALDIRSLMLQNLENALLRDNLVEKDKLMNIVIVGGGPTGVELAGALSELRKDILPKDYPDLDLNMMDIHLIDSNERLLKDMSLKSSDNAFRSLKKMGVDVMLNVRVTDYDGKLVSCNNGLTIHSEMVIWAAGVKGNCPNGIVPDAIEGNRLLVDSFNKIIGYRNIFAIGDVAKIKSDDYPHGQPMMAQPAIQQGRLLAKNLCALRDKKHLSSFKYRNLGSMATIGRNKAVTEFLHIRLQGRLAWIAWLFVHVYQLIGFRNKLVVMINWAQNYFRHSRDLRLIIRPFIRKNVN